MGLDRNSLLNARMTAAPKPAPPKAPTPKPAPPRQPQQQLVRSPDQIMATRRQNSPGPMPRRVTMNAQPSKPLPSKPVVRAAAQPQPQRPAPQPRPAIAMTQPVQPVAPATVKGSSFLHLGAVEISSFLSPAMTLVNQLSTALSPFWKAQHTAMLNGKSFSPGINAFVNEANQLLGRALVTLRQLEQAQADTPQRGAIVTLAELAQIEKLQEYAERAMKANVS